MAQKQTAKEVREWLSHYFGTLSLIGEHNIPRGTYRPIIETAEQVAKAFDGYSDGKTYEASESFGPEKAKELAGLLRLNSTGL